MMWKKIIKLFLVAAYFLFIAVSFWQNFSVGKEIGQNFIDFLLDMITIVPAAFILIGLFEVWVKEETIEKNFGNKAGIKGYLWAILLAGSTVGGFYVALPVAHSLYRKGADLAIIFVYLGSACICRVPMTLFETAFLGLKFSLIRLFASIPLVVISSKILAGYLKQKNYQLP